MRYIISDIHGCFAEYRILLDKIGFSDEDELYVLGDAMDRGPEPIRVIQDIMNRPNVYYILGNHDVMLLDVLQKLSVELTEETANALTSDDIVAYYDLMCNGGEETLRQYLWLPREQQTDIRDYLECASYYEMIEHGDHLYLLVHAGISNFDPDKEIADYNPADFLWDRPDYSRKYFPGNRIFLVTGHTPTPLIRADKCPLIYTGNHHIAIDCGCVFGGQLAAYCIETGEATYVNKIMEFSYKRLPYGQ